MNTMGELWSSVGRLRFKRLSIFVHAKLEWIYSKIRLKTVVDALVMRARMVRRLFHRIGVLIVNLLLWARILTDEPESDDEDVERAVRPHPPIAPGAEPGSFVHVDNGAAVILRIAGGEKIKIQKEKHNNTIIPNAQWSLGRAIDVESAVMRSERLKKAS